MPNEFGIAGALSTLGVLNQRDGNYSEAELQFEKAIRLYRALGDRHVDVDYYLADNLAALSRVHKAAGDHRRALLLLSQSLEIARGLPEEIQLASVLNSLGVLYLEQEDYTKAFDYFAQSLTIFNSHAWPEVAMVLLNIGVTQQRQGNLDGALESFQRALVQAKAKSDQDVVIAAGEGLGTVYREVGDHEAALKILGSSASLARSSGGPHEMRRDPMA